MEVESDLTGSVSTIFNEGVGTFFLVTVIEGDGLMGEGVWLILTGDSGGTMY